MGRIDYIESLIGHCREALKAGPVREFVFNRLDDLEGVGKAVYVIELLGGTPEDVFNEMVRYKSTGLRKCPKLNAPSNVLYVGSSSSGLKQRINQHIGNGHKATYALHLNHWLVGNYKITVSEYDVANEVLQIIEDGLSYELKPAFGKMGGNNK